MALVFRVNGSGGGSSTCADGAWVEGKVGSYALDFQDDNDHVTMGAANSTASNALMPSAGTWACWVKMDTIRTGVIIGHTLPNNSGLNHSMHFIGSRAYSGNLYFWVNAGDGTNQKLVYNHATNGGSGYSTDTWYHLAMTWPGTVTAQSDVKIWINGADATVTASPSYWGGTSFNPAQSKSSREFLLGMGSRLGSGKSTFQGKMDEVACWDVELDSGAINSLYNSGNGYAANNVSSSNLVAYYSFEEGAGNATLTDRGSNGYDGTLTMMNTGSC